MPTLLRARRLLVAGALAATTAATAAPAQAAAPTKVRDHVTTVACTAVDGARTTRFLVATSDLAGSDAVAQVSEDGVTLSQGRGTSDWTASTFRAAVLLEDASGGGHLGATGDAFLSGTYAVTGRPVRELNRFKDGNIRVVEDHTTTALTVSDVVLTIDGAAVGTVSCQGDVVDGSLFFTAPASYVLRGSFLVDADCATRNMTGLDLFGSVDALSVSFGYADTRDSSASSGELDLTRGAFEGTFAYNDGTGPAGTVAASVSAVQDGRVVRRLVDRSSVSSERWVLTPYRLSIAAEGREGAQASATCQVYDVDATLHVKTGKLGG
jgi:hypothetical protein